MSQEILVGTTTCEHFIIFERGKTGADGLGLHCHRHGWLGDTLTKETHPKYRLALHALMDRAQAHAGENIKWRAPLWAEDSLPVQTTSDMV